MEPALTAAPFAREFDRVTTPHLDAAYNLARWLTRDPHDAEDVVQEAYLRAYRFFSGFRGGDGRAWLLAIVRNTCHSWLARHRRPQAFQDFSELEEELAAPQDDGPEQQLLRECDRQQLVRALTQLPLDFREVLVLRELEELSYQEIADIAAVPIGTVMSRLSRGRRLLRARLEGHGEG
ncbi:MAG: sigma-70 family RNA polymerase sigma factor [Nevskiaceae bacterium]|nr:MAG: sigma-70 family RNA polymerase sigma factor [Nevskiaceae bacterium]